VDIPEEKVSIIEEFQLSTKVEIMARLLGILLLVVGIYFLGQNIIFTTHYSPYFWRDIPAAGSVLAIMGGVISLLFFRETVGNLGWILLIVGVVLVFLSGGIILKPTSLWNFFVAFVALAGGFQLITQGRLRF
jgi:uncharacterized membrane protein HdeD (DUF308 family)